MLVECVSGPTLDAIIQIPKLDYLIETAGNQPLVFGQKSCYLLIVSVEALNNSPRKQ